MAQINYDKSTEGETMKSEQPANVNKINALDILLPDIHLTNNEKYDMISTKGGEKNV